jgi:hypothetical protein
MTRYTTFISNENRLDFNNFASFPIVGISTKTYLAIDTGKLYRYDTNTSAYIEISQDTTDLTQYQNKNEKDQASGYLGLDANVRIDSIEKLEPYQKYYGKLDLIGRSTPTFTGGATVSQSDATNYVRLFSNSTASINIAYTIKLKALAQNFIYTNAISDTINNPDAHSKITAIAPVSIKNSGAIKSYSAAIGIGNWTINSASEALAGDGLVFKHNPTLNSGNWQIIKVLNSVATTYNTASAPIFDKLNEFKIIYDKSIETAYFYLNNTLIYTMTSVNYTANAMFWRFALSSSNATSINPNRWMAFYKTFIILENV